MLPHLYLQVPYRNLDYHSTLHHLLHTPPVGSVPKCHGSATATLIFPYRRFPSAYSPPLGERGGFRQAAAPPRQAVPPSPAAPGRAARWRPAPGCTAGPPPSPGQSPQTEPSRCLAVDVFHHDSRREGNSNERRKNIAHFPENRRILYKVAYYPVPTSLIQLNLKAATRCPNQNDYKNNEIFKRTSFLPRSKKERGTVP
jgi:hypothetical protein